MQTPTELHFGIDHLLRDRLSELAGLRVGLVTNDAATTAIFPKPLLPTRLALQRAGVKLVALFAPEHGLMACAAEGASVTDQIDELTGLPVYSLYGATYRPTPAMLANLDVLLFDIPDVGARFYTYIWTLSYLLEACAEQQLPLWILDRPNPLGGNLAMVEGPILDEAHLSTFVGRWAMPIRHSLTVGELARFWNGERGLNAALTVIPVQNWQCNAGWPDTGLPFVPSSPNLPTYETALLYPGLCLFEGTNLSEGRGTATPFRLVGAPWLDAAALTTAMNAPELPGIAARTVYFTPNANEYAGQLCQGVMLHPLDAAAMRPVAIGLHLLALIRQLHPREFSWLSSSSNDPIGDPVTSYNHFDRLIGRREIREAFNRKDADFTTLIPSWTDSGDWAQRVAPYLLYT